MADITWGSALEFEDGITRFCQCCEIDTNKFVVVYMDDDDGDAGKARVATVDGTTITWGTISEFCPDVKPTAPAGVQLGVCKLDTDKFAVVYTAGVAGDDGYAIVGTVSGTTISWGTPVEFETGDTEYPCCCQIDTDKFAIAYNDEDNSNKGTACICTVSGTTITPGTPVVFSEGEANVEHIYSRCCKLDTDKFVIIYSYFNTSTFTGPTKFIAATVSGIVPTFGTVRLIPASCCTQKHDIDQLDTDKFVAVYSEDDINGKAVIGTVSGTTITWGTDVSMTGVAQTTDWMGVAALDTTHFVAVYEDRSGGENGRSCYCTVSGTTITAGDEETWQAGAEKYTDICLLSTDKVAVCYQDDAGTDNGEAIIGDTPSLPSGWTGKISGVTNPAKIMGVDVANIAKVKGVA